MNRVHLFVVAMIGLTLGLVGCGGSSNSVSSTGGGTTLPGVLSIEAVVVIDRSNLKDPNKYTDAQLQDPTQVDPKDLIDPNLIGVQDPRNIQVGEQYWFQLVYYDSAGHRNIVGDNIDWATSDVSGTFGNIGSNSGLFLAGTSVNQQTQYIFATYKGQRFQVGYNILPRQERLIGKIQNEDNNKPISGVTIFFFDNFNSLVGTVTSAYDGSFRASIPTNATTFQPTVDSVPSTFYQTFKYLGLRYTLGYPQCKADLPALSIGTQVLTGSIFLKPRVVGQPTPPATGCTIS